MAKGQFSLVVALYNVAEYVPTFLKSLEIQTYPVQDLDIVVVDDGSTDESAALVTRWAENRENVRLVRKVNGGPGSARNVALDLVKNTWVTFCDPDDAFHPEYFERIAAFIARDTQQSAQMLAGRLVQFNDVSLETSQGHLLNRKFRLGDQLVDLDLNPEYIHMHGPTTFLRREVLEVHKLRFDERIRPKFEDAHLIGRYLAAAERPVIGLVASASYYYRRQRNSGASLVQGTWGDPRAYSDLPEHGWLGMLEATQRSRGRIPQWAQYMVLYDLVWFYIDDKRMHSDTGSATPEQQGSMHRLLERIIALIDLEVIDTFSVVSQGWLFHNILRGYYKGLQDAEHPVLQGTTDPDQQVTTYHYLFQGSLPDEEFRVDGLPAVPVSAKVLEHRVLGRVLLRERILVLPMGKDTRIALDGSPGHVTTDRGVPLLPGRKPKPAPYLRLAAATPARNGTSSIGTGRVGRKLARARTSLTIRRVLTGHSRPRTAAETADRLVRRQFAGIKAKRQTAADAALIRKAHSEKARTLYQDAWLLMDRTDRADDNAEHLYRYLKKHRPDINAFFVIKKDCPDWARLESEGFRMVPYGSDELVLLYLNAIYKLSSHANWYVEYPVHRKRFGDGNAKFVYLQHGVIKDDMSRWINGKNISIMVTTTRDEHESIAGNNSVYRLSTHQAKLTGLPRYDALRTAALQSPVSERRKVLIAPTWRQYVKKVIEVCATPEEAAAAFESTDFGAAWMALLRSPELKELSANQGLDVVFMPHPELEFVVPHLDLPEYVQPVRYRDVSVQAELVEAHTMITDHSSIAFDAAYAGSNLIYMQFDGDEIFRGKHVYRKGYFDYARHGFGPVVQDAPGALAELERVVERELRREKLYEDRVRETFPFWDSGSCARITAAVENLGRPWNRQVSVEELPHTEGRSV
ncbi:bifunctional glycosyltransferase family 2 protein/CDP-glycerol:glycerophosphate glycerophosphotransferase [Arthrobacter zhangbolii]|uniref:Bifunctional glycosyltransferase family 2 protein/CDP-glycerol:glycerophosphate glycerophosphotransferase n=1 Tax=Arthrobacter zhangbolii TaxID=2886936 RepID=A0A9X1M569_9MICC|nr:glycosyltransferase [Arthrobacter zhangbolii]MCC3271142.1 bifunctional glycosyltransferase family 2 protein/CDP-glycerol:glycerophosphate glycerophosphotransferase [Arthrobacter zhangbolii]UON91062.1 bifunctional glycosyltransferase family 2 protein/CDP-glycerol:glycerophosphate glycerophosphotransferase [Arthrobacter zhangbolii]